MFACIESGEINHQKDKVKKKPWRWDIIKKMSM